MQLRRLKIGDYKGIQDVTLDLSPGLWLLYGPNDAGKTNLLEAVSTALGDGLVTPVASLDVSRGVDAEDARQVYGLDALVELDGLSDPAHPDHGLDQTLLARLLQFAPKRFIPGADADPEEEPRPAVYEVCGGEFTLGIQPRPLEDLTDILRSNVLHYASDGCSEWDRVYDDYAQLLDACLSSRWLLWSGEEGSVSWATPSIADCGDAAQRASLRKAAHEITSRAGCWPEMAPPLIGNFAEALTGFDEGHRPFLSFPGHTTLEAWDVHWLGSASSGLAGLEARVQAFVEEAPARAARAQGVPTFGVQGSWLKASEAGSYALDPALVSACDELSREATRICPEFLKHPNDKTRYRIVVEPLEPTEWRDERRIRVVLRGAERSVPLRLVGSGLAVWAAISVVEAMRRLAAPSPPPTAAPGQTHGAGPTRSETSGASGNHHSDRRLVFVIDEPEQHLHPLARDEAARWTRDLLQGIPNSVGVVATHSPQFLSLPPSPDVQILGVSRAEDGRTVVDRWTDDLIGGLEVLADDFGLPRGEILQLYRYVLVVEGADDEDVIKHFFKDQLNRQRVVFVPLRGYLKLNEGTVEFLARTGKAVRILLDDIRYAALINEGQPLPRGYRPSDESQKLKKILDNLRPLLREEGYDVRALSFDEPDILCALPEDAVHAWLAFEHPEAGAFPGWEVLKEIRHRQGEDPSHLESIKKTFIRELGLDGMIQGGELVEAIRKWCVEMTPGEQLTRAMREVLQEASQPGDAPDSGEDAP